MPSELRISDSILLFDTKFDILRNMRKQATATRSATASAVVTGEATADINVPYTQSAIRRGTAVDFGKWGPGRKVRGHVQMLIGQDMVLS